MDGGKKGVLWLVSGQEVDVAGWKSSTEESICGESR